MKENEKHLIRAVCENKLSDAKNWAKILLEKDSTQKDRQFCGHMLSLLETASLNLIEVPANVQGMLVMEDVQVSFNEDRYYISSREKGILDTIIKMNHAASKLAEKKVNYVNSTMLYGESGTGKTTFGRYVAYRLELPFAYLNFSHVLDSYLGGSQKNISRVFDYVKRQKCVFMLDEVDAVGMRRGTGNEVGEMSRIVICLMQCLDTLSNDTVLLGATNRLDIIDEALLRRFTTRHEVEKFDIEDRKKMMIRFFDDVEYSYSSDEVQKLINNEYTQAELTTYMVKVLADSYMS